MMYNERKPTEGQQSQISMQGRLITFEGIDGSGKSTQIKRLSAKLADGGKEVRVLREPGGTPIGEAIRKILLDKEHTGMCMETELLLFAAARAQLVREVILPDLETGKWVICDRFFDATAAYQGFGRSLDLAVVRSLNQLAIGVCRPDITILLDLPVALAQDRLSGRRHKQDRFDHESVSFMQRTRDGYRQLAALEPERITVVDAAQPEEELAEQIYHKIREGLGI
jgi:dTMP kinase